MVWDVYSDFNLNSIQKVDLRQVVLPKTAITYEAMAGSKADLSTEAGYQKYQDTVDMADLYFRTSVPYLYSQIAIKVHYDSSLDIYEINPQSFQIFKTQDNKKPIISYNQKNFEAARKIQAESVSISSSPYTPPAAKSAPKKTEEKNTASKNNNWHFKQEAREGVFMDISYMNGPFYNGVDLGFSIMSGGRNIFAGADLDYCTSDIKSEYALSSSWDEFHFISMDFILGASLSLGLFKPYVAAGIGGFFIGEYDIYDKDFFGAHFEGIAGIDLYLSFVSVGFVYKLKYAYGAGFIDNIGMSAGVVW